MSTALRDLPLTFAALGATAALLGPALPALADQVGTGPARASLVVPALFTGLLAAVDVLQSRRVALAPPRLLLRWGACLQAGGLLAVAASTSVPTLLLAGAVTGVGFGVSEATASAVVVARQDGAGRLSGLGAAFALAAIVVPASVGLSLRASGALWPAFLAVAALQLAAAAGTQGDGPLGRAGAAPAGGPARTPGPLATVLVLYVGAEVLLSTWATELTRSLLSVDQSVAAAASTVFWGCLALGRVLGARAARQVSAGLLLRRLLPSAAVACGLAAAAAHASSASTALALLALAVVLLGPVYALSLAVGDGAGGVPMPRVSARRIGLGALGGLVVPAVAAPLVAVGGPVGVLLTAALLLGAASVAAPRLGRSTSRRARPGAPGSSSG